MITAPYADTHAPKIVAVLALAALAVWFGTLANRPVRGGPLRIVWLELSPTVSTANAFISAWQKARPDTWQESLKEAQRWDTWFICSYAPLFALLGWLAASHFSTTHVRLGAFGFAIAVAQLLAGALDFLENAGMQPTIDAGYPTAPWPTIGAAASAIKWLLILVFAIYTAAAGIHWLWTMLHRS
jgi:hypothetical protein